MFREFRQLIQGRLGIPELPTWMILGEKEEGGIIGDQIPHLHCIGMKDKLFQGIGSTKALPKAYIPVTFQLGMKS